MGFVARLMNLLSDSIPMSLKVGEKPIIAGTANTIAIMIKAKAKVLFLIKIDNETSK
ncbi:hypothetical protein OUHCRE2_15590 [Enterobacter asburiae]